MFGDNPLGILDPSLYGVGSDFGIVNCLELAKVLVFIGDDIIRRNHSIKERTNLLLPRLSLQRTR